MSVKKTANCQLCHTIYPLWAKEKMRGKYQSGPRWIGAVRHLESVHNVPTEVEVKEAMAQKRLRVGKGATVVDSTHRYIKPLEPKSPRFKECVNAIAKMCAWENLPLDLEEPLGFKVFIRTVDPGYPTTSRRNVTRSFEE